MLRGASFLTKERSQVVGISSIARNWRGVMEGTEELKPEQTGPLHDRVRDQRWFFQVYLITSVGTQR